MLLSEVNRRSPCASGSKKPISPEEPIYNLPSGAKANARMTAELGVEYLFQKLPSKVNRPSSLATYIIPFLSWQIPQFAGPAL